MKRGQAAMEFLTTYGWALIFILAVLGGIFYFGVFEPSKFDLHGNKTEIFQSIYYCPDGRIYAGIKSSSSVLNLDLDLGDDCSSGLKVFAFYNGSWHDEACGLGFNGHCAEIARVMHGNIHIGVIYDEK